MCKVLFLWSCSGIHAHGIEVSLILWESDTFPNWLYHSRLQHWSWVSVNLYLHQNLVLPDLNLSCFSGHEVISHWDFNLYVSDTFDVEQLFIDLLILMYLLLWGVFQIFYLFMFLLPFKFIDKIAWIYCAQYVLSSIYT